MKVACRMGKNYKVEYFNPETGKLLFWEAIKDTCAYSPPFNYKQYSIHNSMVKVGERIPYDSLKYGYTERDFKLIEE